MDKFSATWVSHSSINDFIKCPRLYFLKNVYKDAKSNHKITLMSPPLALGQVAHEVLEGLSVLPRAERFRESLIEKLDKVWERISGERGGFLNDDNEYLYKKQAQEMMRRVMNNPGPLERMAVKIKADLPHYWLSEEEQIILCGKVDWLEYLEDTKSVHIIDFKTGKNEEVDDSLQLPIYLLLVKNCQEWPVLGVSYWYLALRDNMENQELPDEKEAYEKVIKIAREIKLARQLKNFKCPKDGCFACEPFERILRGEAKCVGVNEYNADVYILPEINEHSDKASIIL